MKIGPPFNKSQTLEYDNHLGRFTISKGAWVEQSGSTAEVRNYFCTASEEGEKGDEKLTIEVYHREKPPHIPGVANEVYIWSPYNIGYFSVQGKYLILKIKISSKLSGDL